MAAPATITKGAKKIMACHDQPWLPAGSTAKIPNMIKATVEESAPMPMALNTVALAPPCSATAPTIAPIRAPADVKNGARMKGSYPDHADPAARPAKIIAYKIQVTVKIEAPMPAPFNCGLDVSMSWLLTTIESIARNFSRPCCTVLRLCVGSSVTPQLCTAETFSCSRLATNN